ncbi:hypothetical protein F5X99DRAFT_428083 [Biscogniauxia marginata]|nr:hypothetical protein F5X99DRAFT_428083 [Biscogniauxia marginata]
MPDKDSGASGCDTCPSCRQCETCGQESMTAAAVAALGDDTSPPPYEETATTGLAPSQQQHCSHGYNTFDESRTSSPPVPRRIYDIEAVGSTTPRRADRGATDECRGMAITAVSSAVMVVALWLLFSQIVNLMDGEGGLFFLANRDFWEVWGY